MRNLFTYVAAVLSDFMFATLCVAAMFAILLVVSVGCDSRNTCPSGVCPVVEPPQSVMTVYDKEGDGVFCFAELNGGKIRLLSLSDNGLRQIQIIKPIRPIGQPIPIGDFPVIGSEPSNEPSKPPS